MSLDDRIILSAMTESLAWYLLVLWCPAVDVVVISSSFVNEGHIGLKTMYLSFRLTSNSPPSFFLNF